MRKRNGRRFLVIATAVLVSLTLLLPGSGGSQTGKKEYVCPPCGCGRDNEVFEKSGACPVCGMSLIEKGSQAVPQASPDRKKVAILIFDGVQIIDYAGPYEVFGQAGFQVFTVAEKPQAITTAMGMSVNPAYTLENAPKADVILVPGGNVTRVQDEPKVQQWIRAQAREAQHVLSVCNGAFILARTGLLDGLTATTYYDLIDELTKIAPKTMVVSDQRFVDNGKIITTAGLSSGIDGSIYVVSKMLGKARAQMVALNLEYNWQPGSKYARASLADRHLRQIFSRNLHLELAAGNRTQVLNTEGSTDHWEVQWAVQATSPPAEILRDIDTRLGKDWFPRDSGALRDGTQSLWRFTDEAGRGWNGRVSVRPDTSEPSRLIVVIRVDRAGRG